MKRLALAACSLLAVLCWSAAAGGQQRSAADPFAPGPTTATQPAPAAGSFAIPASGLGQRATAGDPSAAPADKPALSGTGSADGGVGQPMLRDEKPTSESQLKVIALRHARAVDAFRIIDQLFRHQIESLAMDERTNSLIVRGSAADLNVIQALLTRLDEPSDSASTGRGGSAASAGPPPKAGPRPPVAQRPGAAPTWTPFDAGGMPGPGPSVAALTSQYAAKEQQASDFARQIRQLQSSQPSDKTRLDKLNADLRRVVAESFAARQQLHQAELGELQQRMQQIGQTIEARNRLSDQIIDRRIKDLLNPDLQWDAPAVAQRRGTNTGLLPRPKVTVGTWWGEDAEAIWQALGIKVRPVTDDELPPELPAPKYRGCLKVVEIQHGNPPDGLMVGDIIVSLTSVGGTGNLRRVTLHIFRDKEFLPVTAEFSAPPRPAAQSGTIERAPIAGSVPRSETSTIGLTAARAYRDKLRERWQVMEELYAGGRVAFEDHLRAAIELDEAELAAAATPQERRAARQQHVNHLKQLKSVIQDKFENSVEPKQNLLAAEAALLKAEAELAAETAGSSATSGTSQPPAASAPTVVVSPGAEGQSVILKSADEFRERIRSLEDLVATGPSSIARLQRAGDRRGELETVKTQYDRNKRDLAFVREQYAAQLHLLELELEDAQSATKTTTTARTQLEALYRKGAAPQAQVIEAQRAAEAALVRLERAKTLLDLYRKAAPEKPAEQPPAEAAPAATKPDAPNEESAAP